MLKPGERSSLPPEPVVVEDIPLKAPALPETPPPAPAVAAEPEAPVQKPQKISLNLPPKAPAATPESAPAPAAAAPAGGNVPKISLKMPGAPAAAEVPPDAPDVYAYRYWFGHLYPYTTGEGNILKGPWSCPATRSNPDAPRGTAFMWLGYGWNYYGIGLDIRNPGATGQYGPTRLSRGNSLPARSLPVQNTKGPLVLMGDSQYACKQMNGNDNRPNLYQNPPALTHGNGSNITFITGNVRFIRYPSSKNLRWY